MIGYLSLPRCNKKWAIGCLGAAIALCLPSAGFGTIPAGPEPPSASQAGQPSAAPSPDLRVEYLGADKGYAVGGQSVTILCVIRNVGAGALPENSVRVRCYPLSGLNFMEGQLWPVLPALSPNQAVTYRWRLATPDQTTPLVFSVLINNDTVAAPDSDRSGHGGPRQPQSLSDFSVPPQVVSVAIPRFPAPPHLMGGATAAVGPEASAGRGTARVGNDRTLVNVVAAQDRVPLLLLAGKEGAEWKSVALVVPAVQVRSAEEGQAPWRESFRWTDTDSHETKDSATLVLQGTVGQNWTASVTLESRANTSVIYGKVRLTARRTMRLYGLQLPRLLAGAVPNAGPVKADGSATILSSDIAAAADDDRLAAGHSGGLTFGIAWPADPLLPKWRSFRLPTGDREHLPVLGAELSGEDRGDVISQGASVETSFRMFVFGPSDTVRDAARFHIP